MKQKGRIISLLLAFCLVAGLLPTAAFAAETDKTIQLGTNAIQKDDSVYYGTCNRDMNGYLAGDAIQWQVLDAKKDNCGDEGMFLLSKYLLEGIQFCNNDDPMYWGNNWQNSDARSWCNDFMASSFAAAENAGIKTVSKSDSAENLYKKDWAQSYLNQDQVFFLSAREASDYLSPNDGANELKATYEKGNSEYWWLRSPHCYHTFKNSAGCVSENGFVNNIGVWLYCAARPAFNLNPDSVLFSSAAVGGKSSGAVGADSLRSVSDYSGNEWKLTLLDTSHKLLANVDGHTSVFARAGSSIQIQYAGAKTGDNEYVSVLLCDDSDNVLYYGNIAQNSQYGSATLDIPSELAAGSYKLKVFSEQCNGDYKTDYASAFQEIELKVTSSGGFGSIPTPDHKAGTEWKSDGTNHWNKCVECGEKMNEAAHDFKWITDKKPTATEAGSRHQQCTVCGYAKAAVEIPEAGTTTDPTDSNRTGNTNAAQTGDDSNIALWLAILLASGIALTGTALYNRKKKYGR